MTTRVFIHFSWHINRHTAEKQKPVKYGISINQVRSIFGSHPIPQDTPRCNQLQKVYANGRYPHLQGELNNAQYLRLVFVEGIVVHLRDAVIAIATSIATHLCTRTLVP